MASSNKKLVPEAKAALDKFKMEAASEVGVTMKDGYNGDLTSKQAGSIGGQMVNIMTPVRSLTFARQNRTKKEHTHLVCYEFHLTV